MIISKLIVAYLQRCPQQAPPPALLEASGPVTANFRTKIVLVIVLVLVLVLVLVIVIVIAIVIAIVIVIVIVIVLESLNLEFESSEFLNEGGGFS